jgi:hypothetical protein
MMSTAQLKQQHTEETTQYNNNNAQQAWMLCGQSAYSNETQAPVARVARYNRN